MTPKEKANKLRYQIESAMQDADMRGHYNQAVKECALIAVNEIIKSRPSLPILGDGYIREDIELSAKYWEEVKTEIEKL
jgi:hypothetical protein